MSFTKAVLLSQLTLQLGSLLLLFVAHTLIEGQVIKLHDPASSDLFALRPPFFAPIGKQNAASHTAPVQKGPFSNERAPANIKNPRPPKPGNIIVRFDQDHEINRLEYVMPDGRLATVYSRYHLAESKRAALRGHQRQTAPTDGERLMERLEKAQQAQQPTESTQIITGQAQTIAQRPEQQQQQQQLLQETISQQVKQPVAAIELDTAEFEDAGELDDEVPDNDETGEILATIAGGIVRQGLQANAGKLLKAKKLISKVKSKFARFPQLISAKLRAKSSLGRIFMDHATGSVEQPADGVGDPAQVVQYSYRDRGAGSTLAHRQQTPPTASLFQTHQSVANANNAPVSEPQMTTKQDLASEQKLTIRRQ